LCQFPKGHIMNRCNKTHVSAYNIEITSDIIVALDKGD
jgi:hypothetical protein